LLSNWLVEASECFIKYHLLHKEQCSLEEGALRQPLYRSRKEGKEEGKENGETVCSCPLDFRMALTSHGQLDKLSCVYKWLLRDKTPTGKCYVFNTICALLSHLATCALKAT